MAHSHETRDRVRQLYIEGMPLTGAAVTCSVSYDTARAWKAASFKKGDNWDTHRTAYRIGDQGIEELSRQLVEDFSRQVITTENSNPASYRRKTRRCCWHRWRMRTASFQKHLAGSIRNIPVYLSRWTPLKPSSIICG